MFRDLQQEILEEFASAQQSRLDRYDVGLELMDFRRKEKAAEGFANFKKELELRGEWRAKKRAWDANYRARLKAAGIKRKFARKDPAKKAANDRRLREKYGKDYFWGKSREYRERKREKMLKAGWRPKYWPLNLRMIAVRLGIEVPSQGTRQRDLDAHKRRLLAGERPKKLGAVWVLAAKELGMEL